MDRDIPALPPLLERDTLQISRDREIYDSPFAEIRDNYTLSSCAGREATAQTRGLPTPISAKSLPLPSAAGVSHSRVSSSSSMGDQALRFNDVATLLPHREFKLHGCHIVAYVNK